MRLEVLLDNESDFPAFKPEHGLSYLIETNNRRILFDSGQTDAFMKNALAMDVSLNVDFAVLSHGHYDHAGGFNALVKTVEPFKIYAGGESFRTRYSKKTDAYKDVSIPLALRSSLNHFNFIEKDKELLEGVFLLKDFPNDYARPSGNDLLFEETDTGDKAPDTFSDEIVLVIDEGRGLNVISGCSHSGILNVLKKVLSFFPDRFVKNVFGGFHLSRETDDNVRSLARFFKDSGISVFTGHCTGLQAFNILKEELKENAAYASVGKTFDV